MHFFKFLSSLLGLCKQNELIHHQWWRLFKEFFQKKDPFAKCSRKCESIFGFEVINEFFINFIEAYKLDLRVLNNFKIRPKFKASDKWIRKKNNGEYSNWFGEVAQKLNAI